MKDLQGHSIGYSHGQQRQHHDHHDSENFTQPPPQLPLLEHGFSIELELDQQRAQENSISNADQHADTMQEGQLFDCPLDYSGQQQSSNSINYGRQNNNPHQSINKPTDGTGSSGSSNTNTKTNINIIRYLAAAEPQDEVDDDDDDGLGDQHQDDADQAHQRDSESDYGDEQIFQIDHSAAAAPRALPPKPAASSAGTGRSRFQKPASSPIEVPARQTRRGLHSMKLDMMRVEEEAAAASANLPTDESTNSSTGASNDSDDFSPVRRGDRNRPAILENMPAFDDDDAFLEREFNENHYNHYLVDGFDDQHLTAEEDPMRLFASIQALAKSLHEDAELFGSLPPKRMLESPVRSMAYAR